MSDKTREARLRAAAQRQGYQLTKSRRRDPRALDYGGYWLVNPDTNSIEVGDPRTGMTLDEIERALTGDDEGPAKPSGLTREERRQADDQKLAEQRTTEMRHRNEERPGRLAVDLKEAARKSREQAQRRWVPTGVVQPS